MAVTTTALGLITQRIDYDAGTTSSALFAALEAILTANGWTVFDAAPGGTWDNGGTLRGKVFRSASTAKPGLYNYVLLQVDGSATPRVYTVLYESWNATTHTGTSLTNNSNVAGFTSVWTTSGAGSLYVACQSWQLLVMSYISGTWGKATGVAEVVPFSPLDTAAYGLPSMMFFALGSATCWCPKTRSGSTGASAQFNTGHTFGSSTFAAVVDPWSGSYAHSPMFLTSTSLGDAKGMPMGLTAIAPAVATGQTTQVVLDVDYLNTTTGTVTDCMVWEFGAGNYKVAIPL